MTRHTARTALFFGAGRGRSRQALVFLPAVFLVVTLLKAFVIGVFFIPSESMEPLLRPGDRILVNLWERPERGDVIVFDGAGSFTDPAGTPTTLLGSGPIQVALGIDPRRLFVKRAIGVPGDTVRCCAGQLVVNGVPLAEPYVFAGNAPARTVFTVTVPAGHYWVMGDHRDDSNDSRAHADGPSHGFVPESAIQGTLR